MNAHQRKKFAKALMSELRNATEDEKIQALVDAAKDLRAIQIRNANLVAKIEELESVLHECRETLVHCEGALDEVRGYPVTYDMTIEVLAKIEKILK